MKKILWALLLAACIFAILNFLYWNLNDEVFNYPMTFRFEIPHLVTLKSSPVPLGFVVITAFCLGILFLAFLQAIPAIFKSIALRSRDRRIRELEKELDDTKRAQESLPSAAPGSDNPINL